MRKVFFPFLFVVFLGCSIFAQNKGVFKKYTNDPALDLKIKSIVEKYGLDKSFDVGEDGVEEISFALITFNEKGPVFSGYNYANFIYPASFYKVYVAAEILHQVSNNKLKLYDNYVVSAPNDVDKVKEIPSDPRPLLQAGDTVTVNYLLDLMISRSDNSAANCLIDIAGRENINELMHSFGYKGSEVTRKYLSRKYEPEEYKNVPGTETCALHAADFLYRVYSGTLVNPWVSKMMLNFLGRQLDKSKIAAGLPANVMTYNKSGWWSYWTNDSAIVDNGENKYIISIFFPLNEEKAAPLFRKISAELFDYVTHK